MQNLALVDLKSQINLLLTDTYIAWDSNTRYLSFPWIDVIGSKLSSIPLHFSILIFHREKDKFKVYQLKQKTQDLVQEIIDTITKKTSQQRSFALFLNPISGNKTSKKVYKNWISKILDYSGCYHKLYELNERNYFENFDLQELGEYTDIICVGGDGTMQELLTKIYVSHFDLGKWNFGIIPTGSQNALSCELNGRSLTGALLSMVKGKSQFCDIMKVYLDNNVLLATTAVAWGLVSDISELAQNYRALGALRYEFTSFIRIFKEWKRYLAEVQSDGITTSSEYLCVMVGNNCAKSLKGSEMVFPKGNIRDGYLDLEIIDAVGRIETIQIFNKMRNNGQHLDSKKVSYKKTKGVTISAINHNVFNIDGEIFYGKKVTIEILPEFIRFLMI
ncbi:hypothetical protein SteCoe_34829 [Stentor coeruleus]|uniref:DAGKc domain-containing protein n=1 Tax=Stentor coeruleus TaxID=5963 RepID=A0A1R2ATP6_9CILI|nr:hypothetical protein SteCoe_34829 [Stentor coeruleus]